MQKKARFWPEGTILKDSKGHWWRVDKYRIHMACASYCTMTSVDLKADGTTVTVNHDLDYIEKCCELVTEAEQVLYGRQETKIR